MEKLSSIADSLVAISMTYNLPKALDEQIVKLIHRLYKFGGLRKGYH